MQKLDGLWVAVWTFVSNRLTITGLGDLKILAEYFRFDLGAHSERKKS